MIIEQNFIRKFDTHSDYSAFTESEDYIEPNVSYCVQENEVHYNPVYVNPCPSEKIETTYEWVEIGGIKWATKNVGALTVTDYGQYVQWGDGEAYNAEQVSVDCKPFEWEDYKYWTGDTGSGSSGMTKYKYPGGLRYLEGDDDAATYNMGEGWKTPTSADYEALYNATNLTWSSNYQGSGVPGMVFTDKTDSSKVVFFPNCGYARNAALEKVGTTGFYLTNEIDITNNTNSLGFYFNNAPTDIHFDSKNSRRFGASVRGIYVGE